MKINTIYFGVCYKEQKQSYEHKCIIDFGEKQGHFNGLIKSIVGPHKLAYKLIERIDG